MTFSTGSPFPLGPTIQEDGINFSVYATDPMKLELVVRPDGSDGQPEYVRLNRSGKIWHTLIQGIAAPLAYGFRDPDQPGQIFLDPYCRAVTGGEIHASDIQLTDQRTLYSFLYKSKFDWENDAPLRTPLNESIIYETHVRGFTRHPSSNIKKPGTYAGLVEKIPYMQDLGITAVELLPVAEFNELDKDVRNPETKDRLYNFWGYDPICFFAAKASYALTKIPGTHVDEFKYMVRELHKAGIEIILDVVFNHTGEDSLNGRFYSYSALADQTYYMKERKTGKYLDFSGCGHTVNCNHPVVSDLIIDCLRYWVVEMHVDGFRFDLASVLTRGQDGRPLGLPPLVQRISQDPVLSQVKLIAEAWDAGGLYQVGSFPSWGIWAEWNGKYRDDIRRYVRGDIGMVPVLATRLAGSADLYRHDGRKPFHSINFITAHDGFTLNDLVSFNSKQNLANGENNRDGSNDNFSWNFGYEGLTAHKRITRLRKKQMKNMIALLLLSQGVPMILAGDELGRTQLGNNNAYCQDNELSWMNWDLFRHNADIYRFFKRMIAFRKANQQLQRSIFFEDEPMRNISIQWLNPRLAAPDWSGKNRHLGFHLIPHSHSESDIFVITNAEKRQVVYSLPKPQEPKSVWYLFVDTQLEPPDDISEENAEKKINPQDSYCARPRSTVILIAKS
jgi:glycogen operon protein